MTSFTNEEFLELLNSKLNPLMEMQQQLIDQNINLSAQLEEALKGSSGRPQKNVNNNAKNSYEPKVSTSKKPYKKETKIIIDKNTEGRIILNGKTYDIKEGLKDKFGAQWQGKPDSFWLLNEGVDIEDVKEYCKQFEEIQVNCASWKS